MPEILSLLLDPINPSEFRNNYYSKKPLHVGKRSDRFKHLFDWDSLNKVLNTSPVPHPTMKMVLEGKPIIVTDARGIIERCCEGASLVIEEMHKYDRNVGELAAGLSREIGEPTRVNLYLSQPSRQGYSRHYDTHDVFILQIAGFKGWRIFDSTLQFPLFVQKFHGSNPPDLARLECTLEPGDVLYIPRGHWHEATAQVEPSMHLTLGIYARTGIDFLSWLADELREDVRWRETFPLVFQEETDPVDQLSSPAVRHFEQLRDLLTSKLNETSLPQEYRKFCVAQERKVTSFDFPSQIVKSRTTGQKTNFSRPGYQQFFLERKPNAGVIELTVWGKLIKFSGPVEPLLRFIFSATTFTDKDLLNVTPRLPWSDIITVLDCLIKEEIIEIVEDK